MIGRNTQTSIRSSSNSSPIVDCYIFKDYYSTRLNIKQAIVSNYISISWACKDVVNTIIDIILAVISIYMREGEQVLPDWATHYKFVKFGGAFKEHWIPKQHISTVMSVL